MVAVFNWDYVLCGHQLLHCEKNSCYLPESTLTTLNLVKEAHPHQNYSRIVIPGYGHLDCIYGKEAALDVFPHILEALDQYAES